MGRRRWPSDKKVFAAVEPSIASLNAPELHAAWQRQEVRILPVFSDHKKCDECSSALACAAQKGRQVKVAGNIAEHRRAMYPACIENGEIPFVFRTTEIIDGEDGE